jgi:glycosyltransferase involved in cell wall biosynthesis
MFAPPGSSSAGILHEIDQPFTAFDVGRQCFEADFIARALAALHRLGRDGEVVDVLHDHCGVMVVALADWIPWPLVHTMRGEVTRGLNKLYASYADRVCLVATSGRQLASGSTTARLAGVIPDAVDLEEWPLQPDKDGYVLCIWRHEPIQYVGEMIKLVKEAGLPLVLAGPLERGHERWFDAEVATHLGDGRVRYLGVLEGQAKHEAISRAQALLIVGHHAGHHTDVVHALAAGTPIVSAAAGEQEVVQHGVNGYLTSDAEGLVTALTELRRLDQRRCRDSVMF